MRTIITTILLSTIILSCGNSATPKDEPKDPKAMLHDSLSKAIVSTEEKINSTKNEKALDMQLASQMANQYQMFVKSFPADSNAALYLFKSADIYASAMRQYDAAVSCLEKIIREYQSFKKLPICYFQLGVIYDDNLNDDAKAKMYYEEFLKKFPDHKLAPQVQSLISYLGKSNEELLKEFEKKNKK